MQLVKLFGCDVLALDVDDEKLVYAQEFGASAIINIKGATASEVKDKVLAKSNGELADVFVDLVGNGANQSLVVSLLAQDGKLIQIGYSDATLGGIALKDIVYHELHIIGSLYRLD